MNCLIHSPSPEALPVHANIRAGRHVWQTRATIPTPSRNSEGTSSPPPPGQFLHHLLQTAVYSVHVPPGEPQLHRRAALTGADSWYGGGSHIPCWRKCPITFWSQIQKLSHGTYLLSTHKSIPSHISPHGSVETLLQACYCSKNPHHGHTDHAAPKSLSWIWQDLCRAWHMHDMGVIYVHGRCVNAC